MDELRLIATPIHLIAEKIQKNETIDMNPKLSDFLNKNLNRSDFLS